MLTFFVSAIWHGFYSGFLHFFICAGLLDYHSKLCALLIAPKVGFLPDWLKIAISFLWCYINCAYFATSFILLDFSKFNQVYAQMYYVGHISLISQVVVLSLLTTKKTK